MIGHSLTAHYSNLPVCYTLALTCPVPSDLELLLCTAGGCCSASLWFYGFESNRGRLREAY